MEPESKFPYCTMELLNSECANALEYVWRYEGLEEFAFAEKAGELLYWMGYADAMRKAVRVINHDFERVGEDE